MGTSPARSARYSPAAPTPRSRSRTPALFEKFRDHAPEDPAFFLGHLSHAVFEAGIWRAVDAKWDGSIRAYLASFPDARAAAADMRRRFKFLGGTGVWRLLTSAARDIDG